MTTSSQQASHRPDYWTTLSEYDRDEAFQSQVGEEFSPLAKPERYFEGHESTKPTDMHRRTFLKLSGFAALAAAIQGCERPVDHVLPYVNKPDQAAFNESLYFASTCTECASACGLVVKTKVGRPIKLEGNPEHPVNRGALCTRGQSSILNLYDPDRLRFPLAVGRKANKTYEGSATAGLLTKQLADRVAAAKGKVVLLTPTLSGPSNRRLLSDFLRQGANFEHVEYDALGPSAEKAALREAFGIEATPRYRWDAADVVLSLGSDFLADSVSPVETQMDFAAKRRPTEAGMSRVYVFEGAPTLTGMAADYRYMARPDHLLEIGLGIAHALIIGAGKTIYAGDAAVKSVLAPYSPAAVSKKTGVLESEFARVAKSLADAEGRSIVCASTGVAQSEGLQLLAHFLNAALGNFKRTIDVSNVASLQFRGGHAGVLKLAQEMRDKQIEVLIVSGVNPAYSLPAAVGFAEAMASVPFIASLSLHMDETTALADIALPQVHGLESWGDAEAQTGVFSIQQPVINVLFGEGAADPRYFTRAWQETLMAVMTAGGSRLFERTTKAADGVETTSAMTWYDFVRDTWRMEVFPKAGFERANFAGQWDDVLRGGVLNTSEEARVSETQAPNFNVASLDKVAQAAAVAAAGERVLVTYPSIQHGDGRSMSNPLLIEIPDPVSKISWDNHASVSPETAKSLKVSDGDIVEIEVGSTKLLAPVFIQPGTHSQVVALQLGWGRNTFEAIGDGIGTNAWPATELAGDRVVLAGMVIKSIKKTDDHTPLANVQGHNYLYSPKLAFTVNKRKGDVPEGATVAPDGTPVYERAIVGETTWNEWKVNQYSGYPNHTEPGKDPITMWERSHKYAGHHWSMSIDMNSCNGCGACIAACNIENNVPLVGKDEVAKGREMFWLRIDRYYRGTPESPDFVQQAVLCQHCGNASCETVCPVIATMHNDEGLNVMAYNRCVGTRYCANNCPYKVRRFNFWQYSDYRTGPYDNVARVSPMELVLNPEVSTRSRGVMEKCSFCNHRIRVAKDKARDAGRPLQDGEMLTACQQTCPAKAIHFGDRNDQHAQISKDWVNPRAYALLQDLNNDPSIRYMTLVRNRDEKSPYRTKYQSHREDHGHGDHGHGDHGHDHDHDHSHDDKKGAAAGSHDAHH